MPSEPHVTQLGREASFVVGLSTSPSTDPSVQDVTSVALLKTGGISMRVFITGASGHIGSAVIPELLEAGHEAVGFARSDTSAAALEALGADVHRGSLDDLDRRRS
jgi:NADPH:quinone reductase-like Zn-dependent oxidoreductase